MLRPTVTDMIDVIVVAPARSDSWTIVATRMIEARPRGPNHPR
jgi:hypothetical protein